MANNVIIAAATGGSIRNSISAAIRTRAGLLASDARYFRQTTASEDKADFDGKGILQ
jgi:hypothetical protein